MQYRMIATRVLFASILIAVIAGVATLFVSLQNDIISRLIVTAIMTAVSSGLLLIAIRALETTVYRPLGITLSVLTLFIYLTLLIAIWLDAMGIKTDEYFYSTAGLFAVVSIQLLAGSACLRFQRTKWCGFAFTLIWLLVTSVWLINIWTYDAIWNFPAFTGPIGFYSPLFAIILLKTSRRRVILAAICGLFGFFCAEYIVAIINQDKTLTEPVVLACVGTTSIACWIGIWNILEQRGAHAAIIWAERVSLILSSLALLSISALVFDELMSRQIPNLAERCSAGFAILASTAILGTFVSQAIKTAVFQRGVVDISIDCPRCKRAIQLHQGKNNCQFCSLQLKITIESPSCRKCGYDLKNIESDLCPECGEPIILKSDIQ